MIRISIAIGFVLLAGVVFGKKEIPQFKDPPTGSERFVDFVMATVSAGAPDWYASWPTNLKIVFTGRHTATLIFKCYVDELKESDKLMSMTFCFYQKSETAKNCEQLTPESTRNRIQTRGDNGATFEITFNPLTGGMAKATDVPRKIDMTTMFYCQASNKRGTITSNSVEINDYRTQFGKQVQSVINNPAPPYPVNSPVLFPCTMGPLNIPLDVPLNIQWNTCGAPKYTTSFFMCKNQRNVLNVGGKGWPAQIFPNGTLYMPYFPEEAQNTLNGDRIFCGINANPTVFLKTPFSFTKKPGKKVTQLRITYPPDGKVVKIKLLNSKRNTYVNCNFNIGLGRYTVKWSVKSRNSEKTIGLKNSFNPDFKVTVDERVLIFKGPFEEQTAGKYTCTVEWFPSDGSPAQTKSASYEVSLVYFPKAAKEMVPIKYVVDSMDGVVKCLFDRNAVTPSLAINGMDVSLNNKEDFKSSLRHISTRYHKVMAPLDSEVTPYNPGPGAVITYTAKKMTTSYTLNIHQPSTQTVDCIGKNDIGAVRYSTILKVVPMPTLTEDGRPSNVNCSQCSAKQKHVFKCVVENKDSYNASELSVVFSQTWFLGSVNLVDIVRAHSDSPIAKFVSVSDDLTTLTIDEINDENVKKIVNEQGEITCVITLAYGKGMDLPPEIAKLTGVFFNSNNFPKLKSMLTTNMKLEDIAPPAPKAASLSWAIALGLSILVVLIVIILVVVWCRKRPPGETYDVDHTEKKQGNDPETENHEKEAFPVYERPEDGPIRGSRASLDDSIQVGSDDEDEDLAEYDVDIGKFNEEGSFIGQYAVNEGGGGGGHQNNSRRLPHVSTNTEV